MARVTVEDCVEKVTNRFDLVMLASQRARDISSGAPETLHRDNDKNPVVALREIAAESVDYDALRDTLILGLQKVQPADDLEEDDEVVTALQADSAVLGVGNPQEPGAAQPTGVASAAARPQGQFDQPANDAAAEGAAGAASEAAGAPEGEAGAEALPAAEEAAPSDGDPNEAA